MKPLSKRLLKVEALLKVDRPVVVWEVQGDPVLVATEVRAIEAGDVLHPTEKRAYVSSDVILAISIIETEVPVDFARM